MKQVYILLTRTNTVCARLIHGITGDRYTHVSLGLDRNLTRLYSFARKNPNWPLVAGFLLENIHTGVFGRNKYAPCVLYELDVTDESYAWLERELELMAADSERYRYSFIGLATCAFRIPLRRKYHYVCSQFVAAMLSRANMLKFDKDISLVKPNDFLKIPQLRSVYEGKLFQCVPQTYVPQTVIPTFSQQTTAFFQMLWKKIVF